MLLLFPGYHAEIVVDNEKVVAEIEAYQKIPQILSFADEYGSGNMKQEMESNYIQIKHDITHLIESELECIKNDPDLAHLMNNQQ